MATPYNETEEKREQIKRMFNHIAPKYDSLNRLISWGMDRKWRSKAIQLLRPYNPSLVLDIATGTGDFAIGMMHEQPSIQRIEGIDISEEMLRLAKEKIRTEGLENRIFLHKGDATDLPFEDNRFEAVTIAFGLRNVDHINIALREAHRVLKHESPIVILELTEPSNMLMRACYKLYAHGILPTIGRLFSGDNKAYNYLPESIGDVPQRYQLVDEMTKAGFREAFFRSLPMGVAAIYVGLK